MELNVEFDAIVWGCGMLVARMRKVKSSDGRQCLVGRTIAPVDEDTLIHFRKIDEKNYALTQIQELRKPDGGQIAFSLGFAPEIACDDS